MSDVLRAIRELSKALESGWRSPFKSADSSSTRHRFNRVPKKGGLPFYEKVVPAKSVFWLKTYCVEAMRQHRNTTVAMRRAAPTDHERLIATAQAWHKPHMKFRITFRRFR